MEFQQEKTQLIHTPEKPGPLVQESLAGGYQWSLPAKSSPKGQTVNESRVINGHSCYLQSIVESGAHILSQILWGIGCFSKNPGLDSFD